MGRYYCAVPQCKNQSDRVVRLLSWHRFPKNDEFRRLWTIAIRRDIGKNFQVTRNTRVCSEHFTKSDFKPLLHSKRVFLKPDAVPSVFHFSIKESEVYKKEQQQKEGTASKRDGRTSRRRILLNRSELPHTEPKESEVYRKERQQKKGTASKRDGRTSRKGILLNWSELPHTEPKILKSPGKGKLATRKRLSKQSVSEGTRTELGRSTAQNSDAFLPLQVKTTTSKSLVPTPISQPLVTTPAISKVAIKNAQVTEVTTLKSRPLLPAPAIRNVAIKDAQVTEAISKDGLSGRLVIGNSKMPDPRTLLGLLKLPPNVMFNMNATTTKVYDRVPKDVATTSTSATTKNEFLRTTSQIVNKVLAPEKFPNCNHINSETGHDSDAVHIRREINVPDLANYSLPTVEMTFECDEPVVKDIKTEPPDDAEHIYHEIKVPDFESCSQPTVEMTFECDEPVVKDIKTEPPDDAVDIHHEIKIPNLEIYSQPTVEMTFECDEPVVKDIKTEPPDDYII